MATYTLQTQPTQTYGGLVPDPSKMYAYQYSEKSFAVIGNTQPWKDRLGKNEQGGSFNGNLTMQGRDGVQYKVAGWIFSNNRYPNVSQFVESANAGAIQPAPTPQQSMFQQQMPTMAQFTGQQFGLQQQVQQFQLPQLQQQIPQFQQQFQLPQQATAGLPNIAPLSTMPTFPQLTQPAASSVTTPTKVGLGPPAPFSPKQAPTIPNLSSITSALTFPVQTPTLTFPVQTPAPVLPKVAVPELIPKPVEVKPSIEQHAPAFANHFVAADGKHYQITVNVAPHLHVDQKIQIESPDGSVIDYKVKPGSVNTTYQAFLIDEKGNEVEIGLVGQTWRLLGAPAKVVV